MTPEKRINTRNKV